MQVLLTGSRDWSDSEAIHQVLRELEQRQGGPTNVLVHGGYKKGADAIADTYARAHNWTVHVEKAQWSTYGRAAGPVRNALMVKEYGPTTDVFVICAKKSSRGTRHCLSQIMKLKKAKKWKKGAMIVYLKR